jgi:2-polyprenyl-3-methyl-5-hydroxy-6-metoxy-1,4-benzoquinol methylase
VKNTSNTSTNAITTPDYWEDNWAYTGIPDAINPNNEALDNHFYQVMHKWFVKVLGERCDAGARLIEIGCGGSCWLPYFHKEFGYEVSGIDYTMAGTRLSKLILDKAAVTGQVVQGDLFDPPPDWIEQFDVVVSFGLVEHFENTSHVVAACSRYLRPGGIMVTFVPTMLGLYGLAYRLLRPEVYNKHIPQSRKALVKAHQDAGLNVIHCEYVLGLPGIIKPPLSIGMFNRMAFALSCFYWKLERIGLGIPLNRFTSPFALCVVLKPMSDSV